MEKVTRAHLAGLELFRDCMDKILPVHFALLLEDLIDEAKAAPDQCETGHMPIPTAEQLAEALENVGSFHDMSAELIAPELLANLLASTAKAGYSLPLGVPDGYALVPVDPTPEMMAAVDKCYGNDDDCYRAMLAAAPTVKAEQVQCDPRDIAGDTGRADVDAIIGRLTSADPDFNDCADAAALLRRLVMEEISGPDGYATWRDAAVAERVKRVAMKPNENIVQIARDGLEVYAGPNMNERKVCAEIIRLAEVYSADSAPSLPAAGLAVEDEAWLQEWARDKFTATGSYKRKVYGRLYGNTDWALACALHADIVAALSAQQSAPELLSVPVEFDLLAELVAHIESTTCTHDNTHRGGAIWEICDDCDERWADDRGGRPAFKWPDCVEKARALLASHGRGEA